MGEESRYRILRPLGSGGMADVELAQDTVLDRRVALKRLHAATDLPGIKRLRREALVGASLNHPNLVFVYDVWEERDGDVWMVMEYVAGNTLRDLIRHSGAVPAPKALPSLSGVAAALDVVPGRGIVHRDVKPANILLGVAGQIKVADLGVAAVEDHTQSTTSGAVVGTFSYMAPEQLEGVIRAQPGVDVYALAAVASETLCGKKARPEVNPVALAHAIATRPSPDLRDCLPEAPAAVAAALRRGMAADPAGRPRTAGELIATLRAALDPPKREAALPAPAVVDVPAGKATGATQGAGQSAPGSCGPQHERGRGKRRWRFRLTPGGGNRCSASRLDQGLICWFLSRDQLHGVRVNFGSAKRWRCGSDAFRLGGQWAGWWSLRQHASWRGGDLLRGRGPA